MHMKGMLQAAIILRHFMEGECGRLFIRPGNYPAGAGSISEPDTRPIRLWQKKSPAKPSLGCRLNSVFKGSGS